jgi:hypothetical protein
MQSIIQPCNHPTICNDATKQCEQEEEGENNGRPGAGIDLQAMFSCSVIPEFLAFHQEF